jgi:hypothetical protein
MPELTLTTELEAVNAILASVGESPVSSLNGLFVDADLAHKLLIQDMRALQTHGWSWNTEVNVPLQPDNAGYIYLPTNTLRVSFDKPKIHVRRGLRVYNLTERSYTFTSSLTVPSMVILLPFEEMPEAGRRYCYERAGRVFQDRYGGENTLHQFQERDVLLAWAQLQNDEAETAQHNVLENNYLTQRLKVYR